MQVNVYQEQIRGQCMYAAWVRSASSSLRLFAPSRKSKQQSEADCGLLAKLALVGPPGEEIAKKWRKCEYSNQKAAQCLKKVKKTVLKRPAGLDQVVMHRPSMQEGNNLLSNRGDIAAEFAQRRYRVYGKRPYSFLFKCALARAQDTMAESEVTNTCMPSPAHLFSPAQNRLPNIAASTPEVHLSTTSQSAHPVSERISLGQDLPNTEEIVVASSDLVRLKVREALLARLPDMPDCGQDEWTIENLASEIALQFGMQLENPRPQLRTVLWNIRDPRNPDFFRDVISRKIPPEQLPSLAPSEMASTTKQAERSALQAQHARESTLQRGASGAIDTSSLAAFKALRARR